MQMRLPAFWMEMSSLSKEHCQLTKEIFSQSLTGNLCSSLPLDLWTDSTMNTGPELKALNVKRLLKNEIVQHIKS